MLALSFFAAIFSSLLWLIYSVAYISDNTVGIKLSALGVTDLFIYVVLVVLPIFVLWMVFGHIMQYISSKNVNNSLVYLFKQMKKNQDYTDLIARIMLESEQQIKDGFIMNRIDILIADMNELIAEIISRAALASKEQIENLWGKVCNGGKWAFGKVIIEISQNQPNFQMRIFQKSQSDVVLAGTVLEFCARYQNILTLLEKHDKERVFLNVIETGIFGKVFTILAPIADEIRRHREISHKNTDEETPVFKVEAETQKEEMSPPPAIMRPKTEKLPEDRMSVFGKIGSLLKKEKNTNSRGQPGNSEKDPFSIALERSFGNTDEPKAPSISLPDSQENDGLATPEIRVNFEEDSAPKISRPGEEDHPQELIIRYDEEDRIEVRAPVISKEEPKAEEERRIPSFMFRNDPATERKEESEANIPVLNEPYEEVKMPEMPAVETATITNTQKTLNELKKEWEDMRKAPQVSPEQGKTEKTEDLAYPFGGWTDESNYHK